MEHNRIKQTKFQNGLIKNYTPFSISIFCLNVDFTLIFSDSLTIFDGKSANSEELGHYCGDYDYVERDVISTGNVIFLSFQTDKTSTRKGFKLKYNPYSNAKLILE